MIPNMTIMVNSCVSITSGKLIFIPKNPLITFGMLNIIVTDANNFMTTLRLLEITEANASIRLDKMEEEILVISIAWVFSIMTSSIKSSSSSYLLNEESFEMR